MPISPTLDIDVGYDLTANGTGDYGAQFVISVPEPAPWLIYATGGLAWLIRRRRA